MATAVSLPSTKQTPFTIASSTPQQQFAIIKTSFLPPTLPSSTSTSLRSTVINVPPIITTRRTKPPFFFFFFFFFPMSSTTKIPRCRPLDRHAAKHSKLRFARKLKTLLLSKPRQFLPLRVLSRCRPYLGLPPSRSLRSMILRYPALFRLFYAPSRSSPTSDSLLSVTLTPAAAALAADESLLRARIAASLASKLQRLLMLSPRRRLLLSKLVHLASDLGLPPDFRSRLCNRHPDRFRTVDTSYGRALELVSWDPSLATPLPPIQNPASDRIIDRTPRFKQLHLRRGLNVKRRHRDYLIRFQELPEVSPYAAASAADEEEGLRQRRTAEEEEKRTCAVVREVLGMTVEKRTLVDHLTHFRKDFGLPNRLRAMLVRHPELFYVSLKGVRDSVFLVEAYDHKGKLLVEDELLAEKERLLELVREGKRMRRERRRDVSYGDDSDDGDEEEEEEEEDGEEEEDDGFEDLFESGIGDDWEEFGDGIDEDIGDTEVERFWVKKAAVSADAEKVGIVEAW
ncbi:protein WHAT'S THIS FACTOR 1, chloroplastic [Phoenix dactylifera]|uniref:Protein WHAT'S THIS FACTOR 1, chloroplastic n=1 Tax=Phoenix dactylifera TaxID=42345 RepID=A0A8B7CH99_PHODC|nr:protein WHAT'S THIS FACTOR 1, chloroplastic [Phoenix dactylifera]